MSERIDTDEWLTGAEIIGVTGLGVRGANIPVEGEDGGSFMANDVQPGDEDKEFRARISRWPAGIFLVGEDGGFTYDGPADYAEYFLDVDGQQVDGANPDGSTTIALGGVGAYVMPIEAGVFNLVGQNIGLRAGYVVKLETGLFQIRQQSAELRPGARLELEPGIFTIDGQDAELVHGASNHLNLQAGVFTITGQALNFKAGKLLSLTPGVFSLSGQSLQFRRALRLQVGVGVFTIAGQAIQMRWSGMPIPVRDYSRDISVFTLPKEISVLTPDVRIIIR